MRAQLLTAITSATSTLTQFAVSLELPWDQDGQPLYIKNKKKIYIDKEYKEESTMIPTLDGNNINEDKIIANAYVAVDAKNTPSQLDTLINRVLSAVTSTGIVSFLSESDYTADKQEDVLIYTFEFRLTQIKQ
jgi:CRISPR/Cas system-associated protein Cas7 (RAMP superfamily)